MGTMKIVIIGSGVSGFSSAACIKDKIPSSDVTIIAEKFMPDITSAAAAGLIGLHCVGNSPTELLLKWVKCTIDHLNNIYFNHPDAGSSGIMPISGLYLFTDENAKKMDNAKCVLHHHFLDQNELQIFPKYGSGQYMRTMLADPSLYMPWLIKHYIGDVKMIKRKIENIEELIPEYDVIINCTALGSKDLFGDTSIKPIRGQVLKVEAPWVKHFLEHVDDKP